MKILQETTEWTDNTPNHIYFVNDSKDKIYAYQKASGGEVLRLTVPMKFSTSRRKFKEIPNTFGYAVEDKPQGRAWKVSGSRGDEYTVSEMDGNWACTCAGFRFRGGCKHIEQFNQ